MKNFRNQKGFTLIEVLLSLALFTVIGIATVKQIALIQNTKNSAFEDLDMYNNVRAALSSMRYDLGQAFHVLLDDLGEANKQLVLQNQPVAHTLFDGRKKELIFTSLSHRSYYAERRECEQTEISYFLYNRGKSQLPSLMKREAENLDDDPYTGGTVYTLVDDVLDLQFSFWDEKTEKWVDDWSSDGGQYRDKFPYAVKVVLTVQGPKNQKLKVETHMKLGLPNNEQFTVQF